MRCSKAREYISQELDTVLAPDATGSLRDHLDACADCREYREDLVLGHRMLAATEPELPENFAWKLQLKLNQALQQTAGEARYPWQEDQGADRWIWLRNFGAATAVGLAAVLALAMVFGPMGPENNGTPMASLSSSSQVAGQTTDRRPLFQPGNRGLYRSTGQQMVSTGGSVATGGRGAYLDRSWSGTRTEDLKTISRLWVENQRLNRMLLHYQQENRMIKARLDTSGVQALDLQHDN